jgi:hypothetical protein
MPAAELHSRAQLTPVAEEELKRLAEQFYRIANFDAQDRERPLTEIDKPGLQETEDALRPIIHLQHELKTRLVETTYSLRHGHKTRFSQADSNRKFLRSIGLNIDDQETACSGATVRIPYVEKR